MTREQFDEVLRRLTNRELGEILERATDSDRINKDKLYAAVAERRLNDSIIPEIIRRLKES